MTIRRSLYPFATERSRALLGCSLGLPLLACVPDFDDDTSQIETQRVLAVHAEPAEPEPGEAVQLVALVASDEAKSPATLSWSLCTARRSPTEAGPVAQRCVTDFGSQTEALSPIGEGASVDLTIPSDSCRRFGPLPPPVEGEETVSGQPAAPDQTGGYYQPLILGFSGDSTEPTLGSVRLLCGGANVPQEEIVKFNSGYRPNQNPEVADVSAVLVDDEEDIETLDWEDGIVAGSTVEWTIHWAECPEQAECGDGLCTAGENATVCADDCRTEPVLGCTGAEQYLLADPVSKTTIEQREVIEVSWYATGGTFDLSTTDNDDVVTESNNRWVAPREPGEVQLWFVVRDSRRGTTWENVTVNVVAE